MAAITETATSAIYTQVASLAPGSYYLDIDGEYVPWGASGWAPIPDGIYTVDFTALNLGQVQLSLNIGMDHSL